ncbi:hypothetical protein C943_01602 [Mariniradius saccharolyticus AK6]|uniref:Uncharacterized protein n=1 Tax=Mariniradius saccharolyticus AK6 TaxID=1239962 RepID=M7XU64_9BACT|nr:hypothetical protein [Mariniradius saccharolyticus]EMS32037.1 hypothetical protein C943_01602 [Mariniradius saccharolyticus AK6]
MKCTLSIQLLLTAFHLYSIRILFLNGLMMLGTVAAGQDIFHFSMELSTNDNYHGRKIRKKPRTFSEMKEKASIKILYSTNDSVEAEVNISSAEYHVSEDEVRGSFPLTFRFDSNRPEEGSRLIGKYVLPIVNESFKLFYNKKGDLLNEKDVYGSDPAKEFELEMETGSSTSKLSSMLLYPKQNIAEALGTMIKIRSIEMLHIQDTVSLSGELQQARIDTSYVQFVRTGLPFLQKVDADTLNMSLDFKLIKDDDKIVVKNRWGLDLELERKTENVTAFTSYVEGGIFQLLWETNQVQQLTINPQLWPTQWDLDQTFTISGEFNSKSVRTRKQSFLVVE